MDAGAVGEEVLLLFLDAVLHVTTGAVKVLVKRTRIKGVRLEVGHDKARVLSLNAKKSRLGRRLL
jgi:hypothetical protein